MVQKLARKRIVPFMSGHVETWAAAILYALGQINFLFDPHGIVHLRATTICDVLGVSQSTVSQKAKLLRDLLHLRYFNPEFSTQENLAHDPLKSLLSSPPAPRRRLNFDAPIVQNYQRYRSKHNELVCRVRDAFLPRESVIKAATILDRFEPPNRLLLDNKDQVDFFIDLALHDLAPEGEEPYRQYLDKVAPNDSEEWELAIANLNTHVSLFEVIDIQPPELYLDDVLVPSHELSMPLIDLGMSQFADLHMLILLRLTPLANYYINSGAFVAFTQSMRPSLEAGYRQFISEHPIEEDTISPAGNINRFTFVFHIYFDALAALTLKKEVIEVNIPTS
jgi:hypothetical protein